MFEYLSVILKIINKYKKEVFCFIIILLLWINLILWNYIFDFNFFKSFDNELQTALQILIGLSTIVFSFAIFLFKIIQASNDVIEREIIIKKSKIKILLTSIVALFFIVVTFKKIKLNLFFLMLLGGFILIKLFDVLKLLTKPASLKKKWHKNLDSYLEEYINKKQKVQKNRKEFKNYLGDKNLNKFIKFNHILPIEDGFQEIKAPYDLIIKDIKKDKIEEIFEKFKQKIEEREEEVDVKGYPAQIQIFVTKEEEISGGKLLALVSDEVVNLFNNNLLISNLFKFEKCEITERYFEDILFNLDESLVLNIKEFQNFKVARQVERLKALITENKSFLKDTRVIESFQEIFVNSFEASISFSNSKALGSLKSVFFTLERKINETESMQINDFYIKITQLNYNHYLNEENQLIKNELKDGVLKIFSLLNSLIFKIRNSEEDSTSEGLFVQNFSFIAAAMKETFFKSNEMFEEILKGIKSLNDKVSGRIVQKKEFKKEKNKVLIKNIFLIYSNISKESQEELFKEKIINNFLKKYLLEEKTFIEMMKDDYGYTAKTYIDQYMRSSDIKNEGFYEFFIGIAYSFYDDFKVANIFEKKFYKDKLQKALENVLKNYPFFIEDKQDFEEKVSKELERIKTSGE